MLFAWGLTEVVRYGFFVFTLSGYSPGIISWLRYNTFLILYPLGASSEALLVYKAIPAAKKMRQEYAWALQLILGIYIPGKWYDLHYGKVANIDRLLYPVYTHAEAAPQDNEGQASRKGSIKQIVSEKRRGKKNWPERPGNISNGNYKIINRRTWEEPDFNT
jgi:Protein tyrosine phosphatase-like protein, PTPLA